MVYFQAFCIGFNSFLVSSVLRLVQQGSLKQSSYSIILPPAQKKKNEKENHPPQSHYAFGINLTQWIFFIFI